MKKDERKCNGFFDTNRPVEIKLIKMKILRGKTAPTPENRGCFLAEREGFEPSVQTSCTTDFESAAFDHSATFPLNAQSRCCVRLFHLLFVCVFPQTARFVLRAIKPFVHLRSVGPRERVCRIRPLCHIGFSEAFRMRHLLIAEIGKKIKS